MRQQVVETLLLLCVRHLFGLYNPNQVSDALKLPKAGLYRGLSSLSLYHAKSLNLRLGCAEIQRLSAAHSVVSLSRASTDITSLFQR